jgi:hypothetical protein
VEVILRISNENSNKMNEKIDYLKEISNSLFQGNQFEMKENNFETLSQVQNPFLIKKKDEFEFFQREKEGN